mmetsp:Transcript_8182/g.15985  ORF Transcript_8182/g.15985 Transcript_8182/m.15985 type:complete len:236 (-) Transcript_8182:1888-2595(-)
MPPQRRRRLLRPSTLRNRCNRPRARRLPAAAATTRRTTTRKRQLRLLLPRLSLVRRPRSAAGESRATSAWPRGRASPPCLLRSMPSSNMISTTRPKRVGRTAPATTPRHLSLVVRAAAGEGAPPSKPTRRHARRRRPPPWAATRRRKRRSATPTPQPRPRGRRRAPRCLVVPAGPSRRPPAPRSPATCRTRSSTATRASRGITPTVSLAADRQRKRSREEDHLLAWGSSPCLGEA